MAAIENENIYGLHIRESANDGSDFTNADADYRKFFLGETGGIFTRDSAGTIHNIAGGVGTAFPATPGTNSRFYRSDLAREFYFDGTRWLSTQLFNTPLKQIRTQPTPFSATASSVQECGKPILDGGSDIWLVSETITFFVSSGGTALGASHKWVETLNKVDSTNANVSVATTSVDSGASNAYRSATTAIGALYGSHFGMRNTWTKTGTPGDITPQSEIAYRIVAT